jgi:Bacteriodetes cell division protein (FtsL-like)
MQEQSTGSIVHPEERGLNPVAANTESYTLGWKRWLNYQAVVKQVPFFLFLALLAVIYIYNGHYADKTIRNINRSTKQVKELQYEYTNVKSKVMGQSKQSELVKAVQPLGLKELVGSPVVLKDSVTAD